MVAENLQLLALLGFVLVGAGLVLHRLQEWNAEAWKGEEE